MIKKSENFSDHFINKQTTFTWVGKFFLENQWHYDIITKTNGTLNNKLSLPTKFQTLATLSLVSTESDSIGKLKFLIHSLRLIRFFTFQKSFIWKKLILQQKKKKSSCYVLQTIAKKNYSLQRLYYFLITIIPYMNVVYGYDWLILISDTKGNINFTTNDISFFSSFLEEKIIGWDRQITIIFSWMWESIKIISTRQNFFLNIPFIWNMFSRLLWSSLGLVCGWGHGGWLYFSKFSKGIIYSNKNLFNKNFKF